MIIERSDITARQASAKFAETYFEEPRQVDEKTIGFDPKYGNPTDYTAIVFRLIDGLCWWACHIEPGNKGWEIVEA